MAPPGVKLWRQNALLGRRKWLQLLLLRKWAMSRGSARTAAGVFAGGSLSYTGATSLYPEVPRVMSQGPPPKQSSDKANRRTAIIIGLAALGISLFMYVSFIIKTAIKGP